MKTPNQKPNVLQGVALNAHEVPLFDVARVIQTLDPLELAALTARYSNGRELQPFRTGFEVEQQ